MKLESSISESSFNECERLPEIYHIALSQKGILLFPRTNRSKQTCTTLNACHCGQVDQFISVEYGGYFAKDALRGEVNSMPSHEQITSNS
jgi:hypothetical protein